MLVVEIVVVEELDKWGLLVGSEVECGFDNALAGTGLHLFGVGPVAEQKSDGADDDTLSGSSLTGDDGKTRMETHLEFVDEGEILYIELFQHGCMFSKIQKCVETMFCPVFIP